jgi:hypothetical protein
MLQFSVDLVQDPPNDLLKIFQKILRHSPTFPLLVIPHVHASPALRSFAPPEVFIHRSELNLGNLPSFPESVVSIAPCELRVCPEYVARPSVPPQTFVPLFEPPP